MIIFDGVSLDSVGKVMIEDIKVSPIRYNPVVRPRAIRFGSEFVRMGGGERTVTISLAVLDNDIVKRHETFMNLSAWAKTDKEYKIELPTDPNKYLECVCTSKPDPSARAWWENKLKLTFTCYSNPFWNSKFEKTFTRLSESPFVLGDASPLMRLERTNTAGGVSRSFTFEGNTISFNTSLPLGKLVIDVNNQLATVDSVNAMQYYIPTSTFFVPHPGFQDITSYGAYIYRERWQ